MEKRLHDLEEAVLLVDLPANGLVRCDVGTVVHVYGEHTAYEVEFMTKDGNTIAFETLESAQVRPVMPRDLWHVRELSEAA